MMRRMIRSPVFVLALLSLTATAEPFVRGVGWHQGNFIVTTRDGLMSYEVNNGRSRNLGPALKVKLDGAVQLKASRASPDSKAKAVSSVTLAQGKGEWNATTFTPPADYTTQLQIERDGTPRPSATGSGVTGARLYWSPDSRFVLWEIETAIEGTDESDTTYLVGSGGLPRAQVLASADLLPKVTSSAITAADGAGLVVVRIANAQKPRAKSVVYAEKGFEAQAAKVASALPGGATVEALTWKAGAEIVIAAGTSALGVKP